MKKEFTIKFIGGESKKFEIDTEISEVQFGHIGIRIYEDKNDKSRYEFYPYSKLTACSIDRRIGI